MTLEINMTTERLVKAGTLSLGAFSIAAAAMAETHATLNDRKGLSDKARVISGLHPGEHATFVVPGYHSDGVTIAQNMDRHLDHMGATHFAVHPQRGFSLDSIREEWLKARKQDGHRPARILAVSMGALLVARLFSDDNFRQEFGEIDKLVIDSGLSGKGDLSARTKLAMLVAALLPSTHTSDKLFTLISSAEEPHDHAHAPEVLIEEIEARLQGNRSVRFEAARGQILFMHNNDVRRMDLSKFGQAIMNGVVFLGSPRDDLINLDRSSMAFSKSLNQPIEFRIDTSRPVGSHAKVFEFPQSGVDALQSQNHEDYRIRSIRTLINEYVTREERSPSLAVA